MFATCAVTGLVAVAPLLPISANSSSVYIKKTTDAAEALVALPFPTSLETASALSLVHPATATLVEADAHIAEDANEGDDDNDDKKDDKKKDAKKDAKKTDAAAPVKVQTPSTEFFSPSVVRAMGFDRSGKYLVCASDSPLLVVYAVPGQADSGYTAEKPVAAYCPLFRRPSALTFTPDNRFIIVGDRIGDVYAIPLASLLAGRPAAPRLLFAHSTLVLTLAFMRNPANGEPVLVSTDAERKVRVSRWPHFYVIDKMCVGLPGMPAALLPLAGSDASSASQFVSVAAIEPLPSHVSVSGKVDTLPPTAAAFDARVWSTALNAGAASNTSAAAVALARGEIEVKPRLPALGEGAVAADYSAMVYPASATLVAAGSAHVAVVAPAVLRAIRPVRRGLTPRPNVHLPALADLVAVAVAGVGADAAVRQAAKVEVVVADGVAVNAEETRVAALATASRGGAQIAVLTARNELLEATVGASEDGATVTVTVTGCTALPEAPRAVVVTLPSPSSTMLALSATNAAVAAAAAGVAVGDMWVMSTENDLHTRALESYFKNEIVFAFKEAVKENSKAKKKNKKADGAAEAEAEAAEEEDDE